MKRMFGCLLAALVLMLEGIASAEGFYAVTGTNSLNLRAAPSADAAWLGAYEGGMWVEHLSTSGSWYYVLTPDGKYGYMSANYLTTGDTAEQQLGVVNNTSGGKYLNLRASPGYSATVLGQYGDGTPCRITGYGDGWYCVAVDGKTGFFRSEYVRSFRGAGSGETATVKSPNKGGVNLRTGPGKQYSAIASVPANSYVMVLCRGRDWWQVSWNGKAGFMSAEFLTPGLDTGSGSTLPSSSGYAVVNNPKATQYLNLREQPSQSARSIGGYKNGVQVKILSQGNTWCRVQVNGKNGYMMTKYLLFNNLPGTAVKTVTHPNKTFVYLRATASTGGTVLKKVTHGAQVYVLTPGTGWSQVLYNGVTGYMMTSFLK